MSSKQRKPSIQPRPTKASMLRLQKQQASTSGLVTLEEVPLTPKKVNEPVTRNASTTATKKSSIASNVGATDGVKAFMAQQRARLSKKPTVKEEEPIKKRNNVMTGAQRYGGGSTTDAPVITQTRNIQVVIKQAKSQGKLNISSRGLTEIPKEVLNMYHVDPNSIVVDFSSDSAAWYEDVELTKFVAGDNAITKIDDRLGEEFGALTHIDFRDNKLTTVPDSLKLLKNLTSIQMPYNQFEEIPQVFTELKQLKELDLSHNKIRQITLCNNTIEQLDLSYNEIHSITVDESMDDTTVSLRKLNLGHNQIEKLPSSLINWTKLQELQVNQNKLKILFSADTNATLPSLIRLDASNNLITSINKEEEEVVVSMPKLVEFSLSNNKFDEEGLIGLHGASNTQTLDISSNQLQYIPASVTSLMYLQRLDVRGNQLHALPYELGKLEGLKTVNCEGNPMRSFSSMSQIQLIESLRSNYLLEQQETLKNNKGETHGDDEEEDENDNEDNSAFTVNFTQKVNLTKRLDLSKQQLTELSSEDMKFTEDIPGIILLNNNAFTEFPIKLSMISSFIVQLNLEHNKLTRFNFTLENCVFSSLKTLKLSNNRINSLECDQDTISFPAVEELTLSYNALTTLPENLSQVLPSLKRLYLSSNKLDNITEHSFGLGLEILDLSNNDIGSLPPGLSNLTSLKELTVYGNRFRVPRPAVVEQGTQAILEFLKRRNNVVNNN